MNQPKVQADIPAEGASPDNNPTGDTPHGIHKAQDGADAKALPTSDRGLSETAVKEVDKS